jgi:hypothetical protein
LPHDESGTGLMPMSSTGGSYSFVLGKGSGGIQN